MPLADGRRLKYRLNGELFSRQPVSAGSLRASRSATRGSRVQPGGGCAGAGTAPGRFSLARGFIFLVQSPVAMFIFYRPGSPPRSGEARSGFSATPPLPLTPPTPGLWRQLAGSTVLFLENCPQSVLWQLHHSCHVSAQRSPRVPFSLFYVFF